MPQESELRIQQKTVGTVADPTLDGLNQQAGHNVIESRVYSINGLGYELCALIKIMPLDFFLRIT